MTKLRSSSHILEIERGRYTKPKTEISNRLCPVCKVVKDEVHFLIDCKLYNQERAQLFYVVSEKIPQFGTFNSLEKMISLMNNSDPQILTRTGKFIYKSFNVRLGKFNNGVTI